MLTEEQARKCDCIGPASCGSFLTRGERHCIGSKCGMAWRWLSSVPVKRVVLPANETPDGDGWQASLKWHQCDYDTCTRKEVREWTRERPDWRYGYCGLAGKPDR